MLKCSPWWVGVSRTRPILYVKSQGHTKRSKVKILKFIPCPGHIVVSSWYMVNMFTIKCRCVAYKTHDSMSKVKVTLVGQRSIFCNLYLVWAITSQVIVVSSWYLVNLLTSICRCVAYKTHDSMSNVTVTVRGHRVKKTV